MADLLSIQTPAKTTTCAPSRPTREQIQTWFDLPLMDLLLQAQTKLREHFPPNSVQVSTLLSIKTGNCPEDCGYCSQSGHHSTEL